MRCWGWGGWTVGGSVRGWRGLGTASAGGPTSPATRQTREEATRLVLEIDRGFQQMASDDEDLEPLWDELAASSFTGGSGWRS